MQYFNFIVIIVTVVGNPSLRKVNQIERMSFAVAEVNKIIQARSTNVTKLLADLCLAEGDEEKEKIRQEIEDNVASLSYNNESPIEVLLRRPRNKFKKFKAPSMDVLKATSEFMREKEDIIRKTTEAKNRIAEAKAKGETPEQKDLDNPYLENMDMLLYHNQDSFI